MPDKTRYWLRQNSANTQTFNSYTKIKMKERKYSGIDMTRRALESRGARQTGPAGRAA